MRHVHATRLLRPHAARTIGSLSRRAHLDLTPCQCDMLMRQDCCILTPQADWDLSRCAQRHVRVKRLLLQKLRRSHAAGTLGSHSVRNETCSCDKTAAFSRRKHAWLSLAAGTLGSHSVPMRHAHAASTLGSLLARKETCSCEKTVAISRRPQYR